MNSQSKLFKEDIYILNIIKQYFNEDTQQNKLN